MLPLGHMLQAHPSGTRQVLLAYTPTQDWPASHGYLSFSRRQPGWPSLLTPRIHCPVVLGNACTAALSLDKCPVFWSRKLVHSESKVHQAQHDCRCLESNGPPSGPEWDFGGPGSREALPATLMSTAALQPQGGECVNINF